MRRGAILVLVILTALASGGLEAADPVAADMRGVLALAFADAEDSIRQDPADACAQVERTRQVFGALLTEYSTRSGDWSFKRRLGDWFHHYCGYGPEKPLSSDGD
jgi:hypothetical protein